MSKDLILNIDEEKIKAVYDEVMNLLKSRLIDGKKVFTIADAVELETVAKCVYMAAKGTADQICNEIYEQKKKGRPLET